MLAVLVSLTGCWSRPAKKAPAGPARSVLLWSRGGMHPVGQLFAVDGVAVGAVTQVGAAPCRYEGGVLPAGGPRRQAALANPARTGVPGRVSTGNGWGFYRFPTQMLYAGSVYGKPDGTPGGLLTRNLATTVASAGLSEDTGAAEALAGADTHPAIAGTTQVLIKTGSGPQIVDLANAATLRRPPGPVFCAEPTWRSGCVGPR